MNIDQAKILRVQESLGWLQQAEKHYRWLQHEIADDCVKKARAALSDQCFDRKPIPGFSRDQQPEVVRVVAPSPLGYVILNSCDYDETIHELYVESSVPDKLSKRIR